MADQPEKASFLERIKQIGTAFRYTAQRDKLFVPLVAVAAAVPLVASIVSVLLAEGSPGRIKSLLGQEKKRLSRVVGETPIYDFTVGEDGDNVSIRKLRNVLTKLPKNITAKQVNALDKRLTALGARPQMPKGPIPKNMRPKGMNRALRGR